MQHPLNPLQQELLTLICTTCNLTGEIIQTMGPDDPLIGPESPLGTDSIDALEIAVTIQRHYGVRMDQENTSRMVLQSLATLSRYIESNRHPH